MDLGPRGAQSLERALAFSQVFHQRRAFVESVSEVRVSMAALITYSARGGVRLSRSVASGGYVQDR